MSVGLKRPPSGTSAPLLENVHEGRWLLTNSCPGGAVHNACVPGVSELINRSSWAKLGAHLLPAARRPPHAAAQPSGGTPGPRPAQCIGVCIMHLCVRASGSLGTNCRQQPILQQNTGLGCMLGQSANAQTMCGRRTAWAHVQHRADSPMQQQPCHTAWSSAVAPLSGAAEDGQQNIQCQRSVGRKRSRACDDLEPNGAERRRTPDMPHLAVAHDDAADGRVWRRVSDATPCQIQRLPHVPPVCLCIRRRCRCS